jgi:hypothetical protein
MEHSPFCTLTMEEKRFDGFHVLTVYILIKYRKGKGKVHPGTRHEDSEVEKYSSTLLFL